METRTSPIGGVFRIRRPANQNRNWHPKPKRFERDSMRDSLPAERSKTGIEANQSGTQSRTYCRFENLLFTITGALQCVDVGVPDFECVPQAPLRISEKRFGYGRTGISCAPHGGLK